MFVFCPFTICRLLYSPRKSHFENPAFSLFHQYPWFLSVIFKFFSCDCLYVNSIFKLPAYCVLLYLVFQNIKLYTSKGHKTKKMKKKLRTSNWKGLATHVYFTLFTLHVYGLKNDPVANLHCEIISSRATWLRSRCRIRDFGDETFM